MQRFNNFIVSTVVTAITLLATQSTLASAVTVSQYADFANNLNEGYANSHVGRYFLSNQPVIVTGDTPGSGVITRHILDNGIIYNYITPLGWGDRLKQILHDWISNLSDPQDAFLFTDFTVGTTNIFQDLVDYTTASQNRVYEAYLPNFLGGSTFIASKAFNGTAFGQGGNPINSGVDIGFGVFRTDAGIDYFAPINFAASPNDLASIEAMEWELSPITDSLVGQPFRATGLHLQASDHGLPEPSNLALIACGAFLLRGYRRNRLH